MTLLDNHLYYGEDRIIGNLDIESNILDYPIGMYRNKTSVEFSWGTIYREKKTNKIDKYIVNVDQIFPHSTYKATEIGFNNNIKLDILSKCIENNSVEPYWNFEKNMKILLDLRNPQNAELKKQLFKLFGLSTSLNYSENKKLDARNLDFVKTT